MGKAGKGQMWDVVRGTLGAGGPQRQVEIWPPLLNLGKVIWTLAFSALWDLLYCSSESGGPKLPQNPPWLQQRGRSMWTGVSTDQDHNLFLGLPQVTPVGSCCCLPICGTP